MNLLLTNESLGVAVKVTNAANRIGYTLVHVDTDSGQTIERRYFSSLCDAESYARRCVADVVPAGTMVPV